VSETIVVPTERAGLELDEFLCLQFPGCSKGYLRRQVRDGAILLDGIQAHPSQKLRHNQVLIVDFEGKKLPEPPHAPAEVIPLLYEDDDVAVVFKPAGLAVEPERWSRDKASLAGALLALARRRGEDVRAGSRGTGGSIEERFRAVHRLDKDTSGCLLVAKNLDAERTLRGAFEKGTVEKRYLALVEGEYPLSNGEEDTIDLPLGPDLRRSGRMIVDEPDGKAARTIIRVVERFRGYSLLACHPITGRTHQIRVHLSAHGFPLAVDSVYGRRDAFLLSEIKNGYKPKLGKPERPLISRLTLHAESLAFSQPSSCERVQVRAPLPKDLENTLRQFRKVRSLR
jgi:RluA family pseudouridine synthase